MSKLHLLKEPPRKAWCDMYTPAARLVTERDQVTCLICLERIERARWDVRADRRANEEALR